MQTNLKEGYLVRYFWKDENGYIKRDGDNYDRTPNREEAIKFTTEEEAENAKEDMNQFFRGKAKLQVIKESEDCLKEDEDIADELAEFKAKVQEAGGLYGYVSNNYTSMSQELLKEIALNALYELDNDNIVIKDVAERYFDESEELK